MATDQPIFKPYMIKLVQLITLLNGSESLKACALQKQDNAKFLRKRSEQNSVRMKFVFQLSHINVTGKLLSSFSRQAALYNFFLLYKFVSYTDQHKFLQSKGACIRMDKFAFSRHKNTHHHLNRCWLLVGNPKQKEQPMEQ